MRKALRVVLSFLGGLIVTYVAAVAAMFAYMSANNVFDRDGGMSMAIMFAIGPLCGLIGGIVAAIAIPAWLARRDRARPHVAAPSRKRWPPAWRATATAIVSGAATYLVASGLLMLLIGNMSFQSYGPALAVSLTPLLLGLAAAALAAVLVLRQARGAAA